MSRIGNKIIEVPKEVEISIGKNNIAVKGSKGELTVEFDPSFVSFKKDENIITVSRKNEEPETVARHGLYRSLLNNAIIGVSEGYSKTLKVIGVGYRWNLQGTNLDMQLGFSHPIKFEIPQGILVEIDKEDANKMKISGIDKQLVGQVSANIREFRKPEPYKGKGIRYEDEYVIRKAGKSATK